MHPLSRPLSCAPQFFQDHTHTQVNQNALNDPLSTSPQTNPNHIIGNTCYCIPLFFCRPIVIDSDRSTLAQDTVGIVTIMSWPENQGILFFIFLKHFK